MTDINVGAITEALNDKTDRDLQNVDTTAKADAVIDFQLPTAENGYTWYRKYKSGWVEQGGLKWDSSGDASVVLPIEMANTYYTVYAINEQTDNANAWGWLYVKKENKTTTGFELASRQGTGNAVYLRTRWQVSGMAAV